MRRTMTRFWLTQLLLLCLVGLALLGQKKSDDEGVRSVQGVVTDASGTPVAQAVVQLEDTKTLQVRSFYTDAGGAYHFSGLSRDAEYHLKATYQGATSPKKTLGVYNSKKAVVINLRLNK